MIETLTNSSETASKLLAFDSQLVINDWHEISSLEGSIPPSEYAQRYIRYQEEQQTNLNTNIGERFNAVLFEVSYPIKNKRLVNPFRDEYALDTVINGQQHRLGKSTDLDHDQLRELAEIVSFSAVEIHLQDHPEDMLIIPSPDGGNYNSNFVDIYRLDSEKNIVKMHRLAVSTSIQEHIDIAFNLTGEHLLTRHSADIELKSIVISTRKTFDEICSIYMPDEEAISLEEYQNLKIAYKPWVEMYMQAVQRGESKKQLDKLLIMGYKAMDIFLNKDSDSTNTITPHTIYKPVDIPRIIHILEPQSVRQVKTGCGIQVGSSSKTDLIFSSLFGSTFDLFNSTEQEEVKDFRCPGKMEDGSDCTYIIKAYSGITTCPKCSLEATCA